MDVVLGAALFVSGVACGAAFVGPAAARRLSRLLCEIQADHRLRRV